MGRLVSSNQIVVANAWRCGAHDVVSVASTGNAHDLHILTTSGRSSFPPTAMLMGPVEHSYKRSNSYYSEPLTLRRSSR
jgi:hypothetical protein